MRNIFLLVVLTLLAACMIESENNQSVEDLSQQNVSETNTNKTVNTTTPIAVKIKNETVNPTIVVDESNIFGMNFSATSNTAVKKKVKGEYHIIEVVDVTEGEGACFLKVDGTIAVIDEGETRTVNDVRIFVSEVRIFRSHAQDTDMCELVIS